ncbi:MAG: sugar phosphate isomerase/epimerase [Lentisphaerae bacterium]|jgi:L-ribulose-5-phosphate 3-epimerase|nr:sugar phosphate isomerase/epimerase [Lentisphaerota bacterium]MBT4819746.1 sugar phosphate isomerase/epimerase [Lentisphaerota bacterium]MBT5607399.1 sugar phosphate isomerase/epimerase [Lentisphaerota bacterium]MBT7056107.1 sugar phosphate isomerase/epimerase [Lentisphaerota bacterium]MBT7841345.1 sugar phosphate isomerase/epimerase [Lentisphaerota bacterium]
MSHSFSRRGLLKLSLAAGAAALPLQAKEPGTPTNLEGRIFKALKGMGGEPLAAFKKLKELGFDGVESGNPAKAEAYRQASAETGIMIHGKVCGWHWKTRLSSPDEAVRTKSRQLLENDIRAVHKLGGSSVLLVPGKVTGANETHDHVWHRSIEVVKPVLPLASRLGVRILIETVWNGFCESPEKHRDYVDAFSSPWVGSYFDIGNMQKFAPAEEWIRTLGKRIVKLDVKDWGVKTRFCRLGDGDVDWDKVRAALIEIGFSGWATREGRDKSLEDTSNLIDQLLIGKA